MPDRVGQFLVRRPRGGLLVGLGGLALLLAMNHIRAHFYARRMKAQGHLDISSFPLYIYVENLIVLGYSFAVALSHFLFHYWNNDTHTASNLVLLAEHESDSAMTSRGMCSLYAALALILPLPISGPVVFFYLFLVSL